MANDLSVIFNQEVQRKLNVELVHTLNHDGVVICTKFSRDGKYLATGCNRSAQIYNVETGDLVCVLHHVPVDYLSDMYVRAVSFSPDGKYLATGGEDKLVRVWDVQSRTIQKTLSGHTEDIYSLDFAPDGRVIASGSDDRTLRLWDVESGTAKLTLEVEDVVTSVAISPDSEYVAAGSLDNVARVWNIQQGDLVEKFDGPDGHTDSIYSVAFSPDGRQLVSGSLDRTAKMWGLSPSGERNAPFAGEGKCLRTFKGHTDFVLSVAITPDNSWVLSSSKDRGVQFWDPTTGDLQLRVQGHDNSVISVSASPSGGFFSTGSGDMNARIWSYKPISQ